MKKLLLLITLCLLPLVGNAQIHVNEHKPSSVVIAKGNHSLLSRTLGSYGIVVSSVSEWDSPITLELGDNKETAIRNLSEIIDLYNSLEVGKVVNVSIGIHSYRIKRINMALNLGEGRYGGDINITGRQLNKYLKALQKYAED